MNDKLVKIGIWKQSYPKSKSCAWIFPPHIDDRELFEMTSLLFLLFLNMIFDCKVHPNLILVNAESSHATQQSPNFQRNPNTPGPISFWPISNPALWSKDAVKMYQNDAFHTKMDWFILLDCINFYWFLYLGTKLL